MKRRITSDPVPPRPNLEDGPYEITIERTAGIFLPFYVKVIKGISVIAADFTQTKEGAQRWADRAIEKDKKLKELQAKENETRVVY